ncbi:hypothetical protein [Nocardia macrotermitis]|uniref:hypothetical protein n=1 Tax=Nocardia macrotermitis TaxID=2585198 RepID=UPI001294D9BF|nr:hypothetical protein [Nocardia macrotermitis]
MSLRKLFRRTPRDSITGTFRVTGVSVTRDEDGYGSARLSGVLSGPEVPARALRVGRRYGPGEQVPECGDEFPATIDREDPARYGIVWPERVSPTAKALWNEEYAERVAAAMRLGLEPSVVPEVTGIGIRELAKVAVERRYGRDLLPDGNRQITAEEATELYRTGVRATATITGIDFLEVPSRSMPNDEASLANVAVRVNHPNGSEYTTTARFGFRTAARRAQIGFVGARVPVRIDPQDRARLCLDSPALPPLPE